MRRCAWILAVALTAVIRPVAAADLAAPAWDEPPAAARSGVSPHPHVAWSRVPDAARYRVKVLGGDPATPIVDDTVPAVLRWFVIPTPLAPGDYTARVRAELDDGTAGPWSEPAALVVEEPSVTFDVTPATPLDEVRRIGRESAAAPSARIRLAPGDYRWDPGFQQAVFAWRNAHDIVVEGQGASVTLTDPSAQLFALDGCNTICIRGLSISHGPPPYSALDVMAVEPAGEWFQARVLGGFAEERYPRDVNQFFVYAVSPEDFMRKHPERPGHTYLAVDKTTRVAEGIFRFFARGPVERDSLRQLRPGDRALACYRCWPLNLMSGCRDVAWSGLVGGLSEGPIFMGGGNTDTKFIGLAFRAQPPYFPAVGGWVTGNDRRGPWIQNCVWEGITDDGPNITGNLFLIDAVRDDREFLVSTGPGYQTPTWQAGDEVVFWNPKTGLPLAETTVATASREGNRVRFRVAEPVPGLAPGRDFRTQTHVYNLSTQNHQLLIRGNVIRGGRRFGFNVKAIDAVIDRNRFEGLASCAVYLENEPTGWEGLVNRNVVVQDNVLVGCGTDAASRQMRRAGIHVNTWRPGRGLDETEWMGNRGIVVRGNSFEHHAGIGIGIDNTDGATISGNTFTSPGPLAEEPIRVFERTRCVGRDDGPRDGD
jgi:hypothetical protein